jgi:hypothetical protein
MSNTVTTLTNTLHDLNRAMVAREMRCLIKTGSCCLYASGGLAGEDAILDLWNRASVRFIHKGQQVPRWVLLRREVQRYPFGDSFIHMKW